MLRFKIVLISFFCSFTFGVANSQNPPQIVATGNQLFCGDYPLPIVAVISISNGNVLPTDDYWFVSKLADGRTFKGHFTLKR